MQTRSEPPVPIVASPKPYYCELRPGRPYVWCACGRSTRQPFCDGKSHLGTGIEPVKYRAGPIAEEVLFCGCKRTSTPPFCDGTHNNLPGGYHIDGRSQDELDRLRRVDNDEAGFRRLDGQCYAVTPAATRPEPAPTYWCRPIIGPQFGALHQSQFYVELREKLSPVLAAHNADALLWIGAGEGEVEISGRCFGIGPEDGVYVRRGEAFRLKHKGEAPLVVFVTICPTVDALEQLKQMPDNFELGFPERVVGVNIAQRAEMGPRFFQMLVDKAIGSTTAAQFIGYIPPSRAEMHKHLYEEALIIASGRGVIWNETSMAEVNGGDVVFLPRKHGHSLECLGPDPMSVVGVIHPGDNPSINY